MNDSADENKDTQAEQAKVDSETAEDLLLDQEAIDADTDEPPLAKSSKPAKTIKPRGRDAEGVEPDACGAANRGAVAKCGEQLRGRRRQRGARGDHGQTDRQGDFAGSRHVWLSQA